MYSGPIIELNQLLDSRTARARRQEEWVEAHSLPLVSFTINMVGNIKKNLISKLAFEAGCHAIVNRCINVGFPIIKFKRYEFTTGYELLLAVNAPSSNALKRLMIELEEQHRCGRMFDIDVIGIDGIPVSRIALNASPRSCILCSREAKVCARSRRHPLPELIQKMSEIVNDFQ